MHSQTDRAGAGARPAASTRARAVVIAGPPASGKTTLGAALARALHHAFIDLDIVTGTMTRAALALAGADETALDGELGARLRDARYGALLDTAAANLHLGLGVVLTGPFTRERTDPARWDALRDRLSCPDATLICLELGEEMRRRRMETRGAPRDRVKTAVLASERPGPLSALPPGAIRLDAGDDPDAVFAAALAALAAAPSAGPDRGPATPDAEPAAPGAGSFLRPEAEQPSPRC